MVAGLPWCVGVTRGGVLVAATVGAAVIVVDGVFVLCVFDQAGGGDKRGWGRERGVVGTRDANEHDRAETGCGQGESGGDFRIAVAGKIDGLRGCGYGTVANYAGGHLRDRAGVAGAWENEAAHVDAKAAIVRQDCGATANDPRRAATRHASDGDAGIGADDGREEYELVRKSAGREDARQKTSENSFRERTKFHKTEILHCYFELESGRGGSGQINKSDPD
jgi:hypothetical protein